MTLDQTIVFAVLIVTLVVFITETWRYDVVAFMALMAVTLTGIVPAVQGFNGFGHAAVITVAVVLVLSRAGQVEEARSVFKKMLGYSNHVGPYAEQIVSCEEALGNCPQAFTHLGLISAGYNLDRSLH